MCRTKRAVSKHNLIKYTQKLALETRNQREQQSSDETTTSNEDLDRLTYPVRNMQYFVYVRYTILHHVYVVQHCSRRYSETAVFLVMHNKY